MKQLLILIIASLQISVQAQELIMKTSCNQYQTDESYYGHTSYKTSLIAGNNNVKVELTLTNANERFTELSYSDLDLGIIPSLVRQNNLIVHKPTGVICAKLYKPLIGKRYYKDTGRCIFSSENVTSQELSDDGFEMQTDCVKNISLEVIN